MVVVHLDYPPRFPHLEEQIVIDQWEGERSRTVRRSSVDLVEIHQRFVSIAQRNEDHSQMSKEWNTWQSRGLLATTKGRCGEEHACLRDTEHSTSISKKHLPVCRPMHRTTNELHKHRRDSSSVRAHCRTEWAYRTESHLLPAIDLLLSRGYLDSWWARAFLLEFPLITFQRLDTLGNHILLVQCPLEHSRRV